MSNFPGLAIPDGDEIDLDLGIEEPLSKIKVQESSVQAKK